MDQTDVCEVLEPNLGGSGAGKEEPLQLAQIEIAVGVKRAEDDLVTLGERALESDEILAVGPSVGDGVDGLK
jgi:hypothetical protein